MGHVCCGGAAADSAAANRLATGVIGLKEDLSEDKGDVEEEEEDEHELHAVVSTRYRYDLGKSEKSDKAERES